MKRKGVMGALMDEYERAIHDFTIVVKPLQQLNYTKKIANGKNNSFQLVITHVIHAGYQYADDIRDVFKKEKKKYTPDLEYVSEVGEELYKLLKYMLATLNDMIEMPEDEFSNHNIPVSWKQEYDLEQLIEHSILHVLRHRTQLEHFWKILR